MLPSRQPALCRALLHLLFFRSETGQSGREGYGEGCPVTQENLSRHREGELELSMDFAREIRGEEGVCYESAMAKRGK